MVTQISLGFGLLVTQNKSHILYTKGIEKMISRLINNEITHKVIFNVTVVTVINRKKHFLITNVKYKYLQL